MVQILMTKGQDVPCLSVTSYIGECCVRVTTDGQGLWFDGSETDTQVLELFCPSDCIVCVSQVLDSGIWESLLTETSLTCEIWPTL